MKNLFYLIILIFVVTNLNAQDVHLSQYYTSNQSLNPALTGVYKGDYRAVLNYRSQWRQVVDPITTSMFSLEKRLIHFTNEFGIGFIVINDRLTTYGVNTNKFMLSGAYRKKLNKNTFGLGFQGGYVNRSTDLNNQTFPGQWNYGNGTFDPTISNNENTLQENKSYIVLNTGLFYSRQIGLKTFNFNYGLFNVNNPNYGFVSSKEKLPFRHVVVSNIQIPLNSSLSITPRLLYMTTQKASDIILSANSLRKMNQDLSLMLGLGIRGGSVNSDAAIAYGGFNYKRFETGISFDFNLSQLSKDTPRKSVWEISLIYTTPNRTIDKSTINCDRY